MRIHSRGIDLTTPLIKDHERALENIRRAPSPLFRASNLAEQTCVCCRNRDVHISRYPSFVSRFFAGLLLAHCRECGLIWVPVPGLDLASYYQNHYAEEFRSERAYTGLFYSKGNPIWARKKHAVR